jgi:outer membrane protein assembly factor BamC
MIIRKKSHMAPNLIAQRGLLVVALVGLAGCSAVSNLLGGDKLDYKSSGKAPTLDIPPDLTQLQRENRYAIPETNRGTATASSYSLQQGGQGAVPAATVAAGVPVAPGVQKIAPLQGVGDIHVERSGTQRWLVVKQTPEALWPQIKDFWQDSGFLLNTELPEAGIMETDWAENRAKIPQDLIRNTIGKVLDSLYSTGERDKFRTRLERGADGSTEIYISHRGAEEVLVGQYKETTSWTARASDPALETEFLTRLMVRLGADGDRAKAAVGNAVSQTPHAKLVKAAGAAGAHVELDESFDRAWRRVGLALDRVGFTVEDRDRIQGVYFVRYVDQLTDAQGKPVGEKGFFSKLFSFGSSDKSKDAMRYRVAVKAGAGATSEVEILTFEGKPDASATSGKILALLNDQLK